MPTRPIRILAALAAASVLAAPAHGAILTLSVLSGVMSTIGGAPIVESLAQESLTGSTLAQLGDPALFDPASADGFGLTVRITNTSDREVLFPEFLPGVSVLTSVTAVPGYSTRTNVAAGGAAGRLGAPGAEGAVSRTAIDLSLGLDVYASEIMGSHGGGGGAGTGVADNLIALTGASGGDLADYLAGLTLAPGEWIDVADFVRVTAFHRESELARIALGFDLPTFSSGGISVTTAAWTGSFVGPSSETPPAEPPPAAAEPASLALLLGGLGAGAAGSGRGRRGPGRKGPKQRAGVEGQGVVPRPHDDHAVARPGAGRDERRGGLARGNDLRPDA